MTNDIQAFATTGSKIDASDMLKSIGTVFEMDVRNDMYYNTQTGRQMSFEDHHGMISKIILYEAVPKDIQINFETAKNTLLYAWYSYRLSIPAWLFAFSTLEMALRQVVTEQGFSKITGLKNLLEKAGKEGLLDIHKIRRTATNEDFIRILSSLRNDIAHGSTILLPPLWIMDMVQECARVINQLYEERQERLSEQKA